MITISQQYALRQQRLNLKYHEESNAQVCNPLQTSPCLNNEEHNPAKKEGSPGSRITLSSCKYLGALPKTLNIVTGSRVPLERGRLCGVFERGGQTNTAAPAWTATRSSQLVYRRSDLQPSALQIAATHKQKPASPKPNQTVGHQRGSSSDRTKTCHQNSVR